MACAVQECQNSRTKTPNKSFHLLPVDKLIRQQWLERINVTVPNKLKFYVCEDHFEKSCYLESYNVRCDFLSELGAPNVQKRLTHGSLPSLKIPTAPLSSEWPDAECSVGSSDPPQAKRDVKKHFKCDDVHMLLNIMADLQILVNNLCDSEQTNDDMKYQRFTSGNNVNTSSDYNSFLSPTSIFEGEIKIRNVLSSYYGEETSYTHYEQPAMEYFVDMFQDFCEKLRKLTLIYEYSTCDAVIERNLNLGDKDDICYFYDVRSSQRHCQGTDNIIAEPDVKVELNQDLGKETELRGENLEELKRKNELKADPDFECVRDEMESEEEKSEGDNCVTDDGELTELEDISANNVTIAIDEGDQDSSTKVNLECSICGINYKQKTSLDNHIIKHHSDTVLTYQCRYCDKAFLKPRLHMNHEIRHGFGDKASYMCTICGFFCQNKNAYRHHMYTHSRPFECETCLKHFSSKHGLDNHASRHLPDSDKRHICSVCGWKFHHLRDMVTHNKEVHEKEYNYSCETCERKFVKKVTLRRHIREVHENVRTFVCTLCSKAFANRTNLRVHVEGHERKLAKDPQCVVSFVATQEVENI